MENNLASQITTLFFFIMGNNHTIFNGGEYYLLFSVKYAGINLCLVINSPFKTCFQGFSPDLDRLLDPVKYFLNFNTYHPLFTSTTLISEISIKKSTSRSDWSKARYKVYWFAWKFMFIFYS